MILPLSAFLLFVFNHDTAQAGTPSIDKCPKTIFRRVASSGATVSVTWDEPECGTNPQSTHSQPSELGPGVHTVVYWKASGSVSNPNERCCSFDVVVSGPDFDLCSQNSCSSGEVCVPEIDRYYCYRGNTNIKIRNCSETVIIRSTETNSVTGQWVEPTAFDHYGHLLQPSGATQVSPGSSLSLGEHDVTYSFTDRGKTATCSFKVIVAQNTGPGFQNCPQDITVTSSKSEVRVDWLEPLLQPNEDISRITVTQTHSPGQFFSVPSSSTVSYTFTDSESSQSNTCTFQVVTVTMGSVTVNQPSNKFVRILQSNQNSQAWSRVTYSRFGNARNTPLIVIPSRVQPDIRQGASNTHTYPKGFYPVTYNLTDADGNHVGTSSFIVTYYNNGPGSVPTLRQCSRNVDVTSEIPRTASWSVPYVAGNEIDLVWTEEPNVRPNQDILPVGGTSLEYLFYSPGSQTAPLTCRFTVSLIDRIPPQFTYCPPNIMQTAQRGRGLSVDFPAFLPANDGSDGFIRANPSVSPPLFVSSGDSQTVTYTATDRNLNTDTCVLRITVMTEEPPAVITNCINRTLVTSEDMNLQLNPSELPLAARAAGIQSTPATLTPSSFMVNTETTVVAQFPFLAGVSFIGDSRCTFNVLVLDDIPPVINNCSQEITVPPNKEENFVRVNWTEPTSVDSLEGGKLVTRTHAPLDPFPVGETTVVLYTFEDEAGFETYCSINITVGKASSEQSPTESSEPEDDSELFSFTSETIVVIVVTAVATFGFSLAIFLMSLCCCTCCCEVDTSTTSTGNNSSSNENQRTRLFVKFGGKNFPIYGPVTPLSTNNNGRVERVIDQDEFDNDTGGATFNRAYQNEAPRCPPVSERVFNNNSYVEHGSGSSVPPPRPPKPGTMTNTLLEMQAAVQNIRHEQPWRGRVVDDGQVYGFDQPANA